jgi:hypothetical protein
MFLNAREHLTEKFDDRKIESPGGEPAFFVLNLSVLKSFGQISRCSRPPAIQLASHDMAGGECLPIHENIRPKNLTTEKLNRRA